MLTSRFALNDLTPTIASALRTDRAILLSGFLTEDIRDILQHRLAICFPGIGLSLDDQVAFARTLGRVGNEDRGGLIKVSQNPEVNPDAIVADFQRSSQSWHFDGYNGGIPDFATILSAQTLPESGGETEIANTVRAFEDLPEYEKVRLEALRVVHSTETAMCSVYPTPHEAQLERWRKSGRYLFPLVWRTRSGRRSLLLGHSASHVDGMDVADGRALLRRLLEWATQPQYVYRHAWSPGDLLLWDNTGTLHRAAAHPIGSRRLLNRCTLLGDGGWKGTSSFALPA
jgi:alpha-ketoglutarate-dependent taurine dioxygenase